MDTSISSAAAVQGHEGPTRARHPRSTRTTAKAVGVLYIVGTVAGALSAVATTPLRGAPSVFLAVAEAPAPALLGASLILIMGLALAMIPLLLFPILKRVSEPLAVGYVVFRTGLETAAYLALALVWVVLASFAPRAVTPEGAISSGYETAVAIILEFNGAVADVGLTFVFALGALMLNHLLFRARLVPRWLSGWGSLAAFLWLIAGGLAMFGLLEPFSPTQVALALPIAIQEMALAGWLIAKGLDTTWHGLATASGPGDPSFW